MLSANVASELITKLPKAGGAYVPVRAAFGETMGLLCGWTDWLADTAAIAALSVACATFLGAIFPYLAVHHAPVAAGFALTIIAINWQGAREGQIAQTVDSVIKVGLIIGVIAVAFVADPIPVSEVVSRAGAATIAAYQMIYGAPTIP